MPVQLLLLVGVGAVTGAMIALQSVINASLGRAVGSIGAVFVVGVVALVFVSVVVLLFPRAVNFRGLPGPSQWYLYLGGFLSLFIVAAPVFLVPRIGAAATITAIVVGQLVMALAADQAGLFGNPRISTSLPRIIGVILLTAGAYLIVRN